jgi:hypothetical protein
MKTNTQHRTSNVEHPITQRGEGAAIRLDCGGKRSATPLSQADVQKAVSPLRFATAVQIFVEYVRTRVIVLRIVASGCSFCIGCSTFDVRRSMLFSLTRS